jgi:hypothetical protein
MINSALASAASALLVAALNGPGAVATLATLVAVPAWFTHSCIATAAYAKVNRELVDLGVLAKPKKSRLPDWAARLLKRLKDWWCSLLERSD